MSEWNFFVAFIALAITGLIYFGYWLWFVPLNRIRGVEDVGFAGKSKRTINRLRRTREKGKIPPPFPDGWFVVAESREIKPGCMKFVSALGKSLVVFRGSETGQIFVVDAHCPHLGANFSSGGKVSGDCVVCPFHSWKFDGNSGDCTDIPYADKIPGFTRIKSWRCTETNGLVYFWHHADPKVEPKWNPVIIPEINGWVYQGRNEYEVSCHIQDIPENGSDVAHLDSVHRVSIIAGGEPSQRIQKLTSFLAHHEWSIQWNPHPEEAHKAQIQLKHSMKLFGCFPILSLDVEAEQIGPSFVHLHFKSPYFGRGVMLQYILPLEPMTQKLVHVFYTERSWPPPYAKLVLWGESILLERDISVWNNKSYIDKPILVKEDKLIGRHRRWYSQFYSEKSLKLGEIRSKGDDDW